MKTTTTKKSTELTDTENRLVVARGKGVREMVVKAVKTYKSLGIK